MVPVYATPAELADWLPGDVTAPTGTAADRLLERASRDVYRATVTACYDADDTGMPTDADILAAFKAATLEQAAWRLENGDDGAAAGMWDQVGIGSANLRRRAGAVAPKARAAGRGLGADALAVLQAAGLVGTHPIIC